MGAAKFQQQAYGGLRYHAPRSREASLNAISMRVPAGKTLAFISGMPADLTLQTGGRSLFD
ncbi:hypothetical protein BMI90_12930 [Thioclava sp. L04-15]|nr:hypothetical protein BMI90_12930 [Thioclava sp. L04-15]